MSKLIFEKQKCEWMKCDAWFWVGQRGNEWSVKQLSKDSVCIACSIKEIGGENLNFERHIGGQTDQYGIGSEGLAKSYIGQLPANIYFLKRVLQICIYGKIQQWHWTL